MPDPRRVLYAIGVIGLLLAGSDVAGAQTVDMFDRWGNRKTPPGGRKEEPPPPTNGITVFGRTEFTVTFDRDGRQETDRGMRGRDRK